MDEPRCPCGNAPRFYSALDEQAYCSDTCYNKGKEQTAPELRYVAHGVYEVKE